MSTWLINEATPESLGLQVVGGTFRSGYASSVQLSAVRDFDAAELLSGYGGTVTIKRNGSAFFKGKIRAIPKMGSGSAEGQDYLVEDAWAELERTTYQEPWATGAGSVLLPRCFLGVNAVGTRITLAQQITEALDFAIAAGVSLQVGSVPTGMLLWPEEVDGMSCAQVIRTSLRYHPDWIPWIDHTTTPPTFNVTPRASATAMAIAATACSQLTVTETQDSLPDVVRICFITASEVDGEQSRSVTIQKFPATIGGDPSPDSGPGVLSTTVDLQGVRAAYQKQQVKTRSIPTDAASCRTWLKKKFPSLAGVPDEAYTIEDFETALIVDADDNPDPINAAAPRMAAETLSDCPRELIEGSVHEWMRKKVGKVHVKYTLSAGDLEGWLTHFKTISAAGQGISVTGTNAITKTYKGLSSYSSGDDIPAGVAEAYYNTIHAGCRYQGSITLLTDSLSTPWHGKKLNLTAGVSAWATMGAPIHAVRWDAQSEEASIEFGPTPEYSVQDFLAFLKLLRNRPATWITGSDRTSEALSSNAPEVIGGAVLPTDIPEPKNGGEKFSKLFLFDAGDDPTEETEPDLEWQHGLESAGSADAEEPAEVKVELPVVADIEDPAAEPAVVAQVKVSKHATKRIFTVRGNSIDGSIVYIDPVSSSPVTVIEWKDGLIITDAAAEAIEIPLAGGGDLPEGTEGDLLRHTGEGGWQVLSGYEEVTVLLCNSEGSASYTMLAKLNEEEE
jgi:hypothetical protein